MQESLNINICLAWKIGERWLRFTTNCSRIFDLSWRTSEWRKWKEWDPDRLARTYICARAITLLRDYVHFGISFFLQWSDFLVIDYYGSFHDGINLSFTETQFIKLKNMGLWFNPYYSQFRCPYSFQLFVFKSVNFFIIKKYCSL